MKTGFWCGEEVKIYKTIKVDSLRKETQEMVLIEWNGSKFGVYKNKVKEKE
jgi:hypothetical protein